MKWMNTPLKPLRLACLALILGSGLASAAEPIADQYKPAVEATMSQPMSANMQTQPIRLAWDRVGAMA